MARRKSEPLDPVKSEAEYLVKGVAWRILEYPLLHNQFKVPKDRLHQFHEYCSEQPQLANGWRIARMIFGIEPVVPELGSNPDFYGSARTIDEVAEAIARPASIVEADMEMLLISWKTYYKKLPALEYSMRLKKMQSDTAASKERDKDAAKAAPEEHTEISCEPLNERQLKVLRSRGFTEAMFIAMDPYRPKEETNAEMQWFVSRLDEMGKVFDEPAAKALARQALINELLIRRMDIELLGMPIAGAKFEALAKTKQQTEEKYRQQWKQLEDLCPYLRQGATKQVVMGVISDLVLGLQEWHQDRTRVVFDEVFNHYEWQTMLQQSEQDGDHIPPQYRPEWVLAVIVAQAGLFDPNFKKSIPAPVSKMIHTTFHNVVRWVNEKYKVRIPNLLIEGEGGEFDDLQELPELPDSAEAELGDQITAMSVDMEMAAAGEENVGFADDEINVPIVQEFPAEVDSKN